MFSVLVILVVIIGGCSSMRTSRYLAALKDGLDSPERRKNWLLELQALDLEARESVLGA